MFGMIPDRRPMVAIADPIDDERQLYALAFDHSGLNLVVLPAESPSALLARIVSVQPDAVLHRIQPHHAGTALILALRSDPRTTAIPIVIITTDSRLKMHDAARAAGATDILMLPLDPFILADHVQRLIVAAPGCSDPTRPRSRGPCAQGAPLVTCPLPQKRSRLVAPPEQQRRILEVGSSSPEGAHGDHPPGGGRLRRRSAEY